MFEEIEEYMINMFSLVSSEDDLDLPPEVSINDFTEAYGTYYLVRGSNILNKQIVSESPEKRLLYYTSILLVVGVILPLMTTMTVPDPLVVDLTNVEVFTLEVIHLTATLGLGGYSITKLVTTSDNIL